jgi:DHA3 family macrolide efflux protein-like MFS transporter
VTAWIGQAFSLLGSQLVQFALIWWLTLETGKATTLAMAALAGLLPQVVIGPLAGALVDRWNRKLIMVVADGVVALVTVGLVLDFWSGQMQVWHVILAMFLRSAAGSFQYPAWQASTSLMAPAEHLARIQGFNQMLAGAMNICAAPLGALLISFLPMAQVLAVDILTAALAIGLILVVRIPQPKAMETAAGGSQASVSADLRAGLRYTMSWPGLVWIGIMAMLINLVLAPASSLIPILVTKHFGGQAYELAWMESALAVGMIAGGLLLGAWGGFKRRIYTSLVGLLIIGMSHLVIGFSPANGYWLAAVMILVAGIAVTITNGPLMAVIQATVPPEMQGRVFTLIGSVGALMAPLGLVIAGPLADAFGVQMWFVTGGVVTGLLGLVGFFVPAIVHFEEGRAAAVREVEQAPAGVYARDSDR